MKEIEKIAALLSSDAMEKQIAAAIVLGELGEKNAKVTAGLRKLMESTSAPLQRHALDALGRIDPQTALEGALKLLTSSDVEVRQAATRAAAAGGDKTVAAIKEKLKAGATPEEKRALDGVLASMGSGEAFHVLLASLDNSDPEGARAAALAVRQRIRDADGRSRRSYLSETEKFLKSKKVDQNPGAASGALKILGFLEDEKSVPLLLSWLKRKDATPGARQEAAIALRFALKEGGDSAKVIDALVEVAEGEDRMLARTAFDTILGLELTPALTQRLGRLAGHPDGDRARVAIERLGQQKSRESTRALVEIVTREARVRAEQAMAALNGHEDVAPLLARQLLKATDADRAWLIRKAIKAHPGKLDKKIREELLDSAFERISAGTPGWEAALEVCRDSDPEHTAEGLRELAARLKKAKKADRAVAAFHVLCRSEHATDADRYILGSLELERSRKDVHLLARERDESIRIFTQLMERHFNLGEALRKDKSIGVEEKFYLGFHFAEKGYPLGEDLLEEVVKEAGRTKLGKIARNKLKLVAEA